MPAYLLFPLTASILYVFATLFLKRSAVLGAGVLATTVVANIATAVAFLTLLPMGGQVPSWAALWQPALVGALFVVGQLLTFLALKVGDVSVATPVMGVKTVVVAGLLTVLLSASPPLRVWIAALLSAAAIALLNANGGGRHRRVLLTSTYAFAAASSFAMFDVLVQKFSPAWGAGRFLPIAMGVSALLSLPAWPLAVRSAAAAHLAAGLADPSPIPHEARRPLVIGAVLLGMQVVVLVGAIGVFGDAARINVVYASRGLWSVSLVWLIGHRFHNDEHHLPPRVLRMRLLGAALMTAAIILALSP